MVIEYGRSAYPSPGIPEDEYFERPDELESLVNLFGRASRGHAVGGLIEGLRAVGKTDLVLRAIERHMQSEPSAILVYYSLQPYSLGFFDFVRSYFNTFIRQYQYSLLRDEFDLQSCVDAWHSESPLCADCSQPVLREICEAMGRAYNQRDATNTLSLLVNMPHYLAELQGHRIVVVFDQARYFLQIHHKKTVVPMLRHIVPNLESPIAPMFLVDSKVALRTMLGDQVAQERMSIHEVRPLERMQSLAMLQSLAERQGVELSVRPAETTVGQLGGIPFYLHSVVRRAHLNDWSLDTSERFGLAYAEEIRDGTAHWYWRAQFSTQFPNALDRHRAVELCSFLALLHPQRANLARLSQRLNIEPKRLQDLIYRLQLIGVLDRSFGTVGLATDPVLRDLVTVLAWGENSTISDDELLRRLAARRIRGASTPPIEETIDEFLTRLQRLLESFRGQYLPAEWFHYHEDYGAGWIGPEGIRRWLGSSDTLIRLPFITAASRLDLEETATEEREERFGPVVICGTGFQDKSLTRGNETAWAAVVWPDTDPIEADRVHQAARLREAAARRIDAKVRHTWLIGKATFTREARNLCSRLNILSGNMDMVDYIYDQMFAKGSPWRDQEAPPTQPEMIVTPAGREAEPDTYEISLPAKGYPERVAIETLEEIAQAAGFSLARTGQMKMALLEAVINMAEASRDPADKISVRYEVHADRMEVFVRSGFASGLREAGAAEPVEARSPVAGWGLRMIYTLADEVTIRPLEQGTEIHMTCRRESAG